jgi:hypothetical protein
VLLERETLSGDEFRALLRGETLAPLPPPVVPSPETSGESVSGRETLPPTIPSGGAEQHQPA